MIQRFFLLVIVIILYLYLILHGSYPNTNTETSRRKKVIIVQEDPWILDDGQYNNKRLLVSILMYESPAYMRFHLEMTLGKLHPSTGIVLHLNIKSNHPNRTTRTNDSDWNWILSQRRIIINPQRFPVAAFTGWLSYAHLSNIQYATSLHYKFSHAILIASNSFLLRSGIEELVFKNDASDRLGRENCYKGWKYCLCYGYPSSFPMKGKVYMMAHVPIQVLKVIANDTSEAKHPNDLKKQVANGFHEFFFAPIHVFEQVASRFIGNKELTKLLVDTPRQVEEILFPTSSLLYFRLPSLQYGAYLPTAFLWDMNDTLVYDMTYRIATNQEPDFYGMKIHGGIRTIGSSFQNSFRRALADANLVRTL